MDSNQLIENLFKFQTRLSIDDQQRLHAFLGKNLVQRIDEDSTLHANLSLVLSQWDHEDMKPEDIQALIKASKDIQCTDYAQHLKQHVKRIRFHEENSIPLLPVKKPRKGSRNHRPFAAVMDHKGRTSIQTKPTTICPKILTSRLAVIRSLILIAVLFGGCFLVLRLHIRAKQTGSNSTSSLNISQFNSTSSSSDRRQGCIFVLIVCHLRYHI